jgi:anti-sigma-K factor RskA
MNRIKLLIAATTIVAATVFGIGSQVLATQQTGAPSVASLCCYRP